MLIVGAREAWAGGKRVVPRGNRCVRVVCSDASFRLRVRGVMIDHYFRIYKLLQADIMPFSNSQSRESLSCVLDRLDLA